MKNKLKTLFAFLLILLLTACGGNTATNDTVLTPTPTVQILPSNSPRDNDNDRDDDTEVSDTKGKSNQPDNNYNDNNSSNSIDGITTFTTLSEISEMVDKDVSDSVDSLLTKYQTLINDIDTYEKYKNNSESVKSFYDTALQNTKELCIRLREYSVYYAEIIITSDKSKKDKYDNLEKIYDCIYDTAGNDIYDEIYDGILDDIYDTYYDGILNDAYGDTDYKEWSDARSNEYKWWSDTRSDVYKEWSRCRSDIYGFWSDMRSAVWRDDMELAEEKLADFRDDVERLKERNGRSSVRENTDENESSSISTNEVNPSNQPEYSEGTNLVDGMRPEFKAAMDSYEAFYDEYCEFMKKYSENSSDLSLLAQYGDMMAQLSTMNEKFEEWNNEEMNSAELNYYLEVNNRVMQKLIDISMG